MSEFTQLTQLTVSKEILETFARHEVTKIEGIAILEVIKFSLLNGE